MAMSAAAAVQGQAHGRSRMPAALELVAPQRMAVRTAVDAHCRPLRYPAAVKLGGPGPDGTPAAVKRFVPSG